jgi:hypothetical protein
MLTQKENEVKNNTEREKNKTGNKLSMVVHVYDPSYMRGIECPRAPEHVDQAPN